MTKAQLVFLDFIVRIPGMQFFRGGAWNALIIFGTCILCGALSTPRCLAMRGNFVNQDFNAWLGFYLLPAGDINY